MGRHLSLYAAFVIHAECESAATRAALLTGSQGTVQASTAWKHTRPASVLPKGMRSVMFAGSAQAAYQPLGWNKVPGQCECRVSTHSVYLNHVAVSELHEDRMHQQ